jgi:hypothetical protein
MLRQCVLLGALVLGCGGSDDDSSGANGGTSSGGTSSGGTSSGGTSSGGTSSGGTSGGSGGTSSGGSAGTSTGGTSNFTPYFHDDFEGYADGASLTNNQPFDAAGNTSASTEQAKSGTKSAKMAIHPSDGGGFGNWGGIVPISPGLEKGKEIWVRLYVMWPASFEFSASPFMKFLRLHNATSAGDNAGYNDLYVDQADATQSVLRTIKEVHDVWDVYDGPKLPRDTWERYEMYLYVDDQPVDSGGQARVRIWRDDTLIFNRTDVPTITESDGVIDYFYLFTYWNNEQPPDNYVYVDDLTLATSANPPPNVDSSGNAFIGAWPN